MRKIMPPDKGAALRARFIDAFVDTSTDRFRELIKVKPTDIVYFHSYYRTYMWDTLSPGRYTVVPYHRCIETIAEKKRVYSLWDIFPQKIIYPDKFPGEWIKPRYLELYPGDAVIEWDTDELLSLLKVELEDYDATGLDITLPEDLYIFDDSFSFCAIFTHESTQELVPGIPGERFCILCTGKPGIAIR